MNIGTRLILSAALAVGSTIGAAALGQTALRDSPAEVAPPATGDDRSTDGDRSSADAATTTIATVSAGAAFGDYPGLADAERIHTAAEGALDAKTTAAEPPDAGARVDGVRAELLAAAEAGEISWAAAERVSEDIGTYIRGERRADVI